MMSAGEPESDPLIGTTLGGAYRVLRHVDEGGMGAVYEAEHIRLNRRVAVKVMAQHLENNQGALERFAQEAEIVSQLNHPHVVQVHDYNTTADGKPYFVMELLKGRSLAQVLSLNGKLNPSISLQIAVQAASALTAAHHANVVHRDLKPANIFLLDAGDQLFVKLLDFGISKRNEGSVPKARKLTGEFDILGTPDYMPPEQAAGKTAFVDARGDQYALAVIVYEMLTGTVPFHADDVMELLQKVIFQPPTPANEHNAEVPDDLNQTLLKALAKRPEERFASMSLFAEQLTHAAKGLRPAVKSDFKQLGDQKPNSSESHLRHDESGSIHSDSERTSWHSKDPQKAIEDLVSRARQELGLDNLPLALSCAESALEIARRSELEGVRAIARANATLFEHIFTRKLGDLSSVIALNADAPTTSQLSPEQAFLLSRLEGGLSLDEALDLSPMPREITLGQVLSLLRMGQIRLGA